MSTADARTFVAVVFIVVMGGLGPEAAAQIGPEERADALTSQERPVRIAVQPTYQRFDDDGVVLTEWSAPVQAIIPFQDRWQLSVRGNIASAGGDDLEQVSGLTDVRTTLSYASPVGAGSVILTGSVTAPTGKQNLTQDEFDTATLLSQNFYRVRVPSFGQGLAAGAGATWAVPVGEAVVVGFGGSYQYRGSYEPVVGQTGTYDPGDEGRLTGGVDVRLGRASSLSGDLSLFLYGTDTLNGTDRFTVGNQVAVRVQYLYRRESRSVQVVARYEGQGNSTLPVVDGEDRELQVLPSEGELRGRYSTRVADGMTLGVFAAGRWYDETTEFDTQTLATIGIEPRFDLNDTVALTPRIAYTGGSFTGIEGGVGLVVTQ